VHNVSDVRQIEIHTAEPLVLGPCHLEVYTAITKLKNINFQVVIKSWQNSSKPLWFLGTEQEVPDSITGATRFLEK
jgi:hypothetical protein